MLMQYRSMKLPTILLVAVSLGCALADCTQSFGLLNRTTEICEGFSLVLECSTKRTMSTVFKGNLMNCSSSEIVLLHSRFNSSNGTDGKCNNEKVLGQSLPTDDLTNCYTSLLCIMVTPDMIGKTVSCSQDNGTTVNKIGYYSIQPISITTLFIAINSPKSGEAEAIVISCSVILVGIVIVAIILSACGFIFRRKQLQSVTTISRVHTSRADAGQQTSFHCTQHDEVSGYARYTMDYDRVVIVTDDSEYSHLQHPTGQRAQSGSRDIL